MQLSANVIAKSSFERQSTGDTTLSYREGESWHSRSSVRGFPARPPFR